MPKIIFERLTVKEERRVMAGDNPPGNVVTPSLPSPNDLCPDPNQLMPETIGHDCHWPLPDSMQACPPPGWAKNGKG